LKGNKFRRNERIEVSYDSLALMDILRRESIVQGPEELAGISSIVYLQGLDRSRESMLQDL
jgi:hypothetical protein